MTIKKGGTKESKAEIQRNKDRSRNVWQLWAIHDMHSKSVRPKCQLNLHSSFNPENSVLFLSSIRIYWDVGTTVKFYLSGEQFFSLIRPGLDNSAVLKTWPRPGDPSVHGYSVACT